LPEMSAAKAGTVQRSAIDTTSRNLNRFIVGSPFLGKHF
jgi:hypothetical protein